MSTPSDKKDHLPETALSPSGEAGAGVSDTAPAHGGDSAVPAYMQAKPQAAQPAADAGAPVGEGPLPAAGSALAAPDDTAEAPDCSSASVIAVAPDGLASCEGTVPPMSLLPDDSRPAFSTASTEADAAHPDDAFGKNDDPHAAFAESPDSFSDFAATVFSQDDESTQKPAASPLADALTDQSWEDGNADAPFFTAQKDAGQQKTEDAPQEAATTGPASAKPEQKKLGMFGRSKTDGKTDKKQPAAQPASRAPGFAATHPLLPVENAMPPGIFSRLYTVLAVSPLLVLTFLLVLQTIFTLDARSLWFSDEVRHADAFARLLHEGKGLILELNGQPYPDKPPLYFWFLRGLYALLGTEGPMLHFTAAAVSGLLFLWASLGAATHIGRLDRRGRLGFGLMLLSTGYFVGLLHYARMDFLFASLIMAAHVFLYRALVNPQRALVPMLAAFGLAGIATLVKGPLALAFLLCTALPFAMWRGTADRFICFLVMLWSAVAGAAVALLGLPLLQRIGLLAEMTELPPLWSIGLLGAAAVPALAAGTARRELRRGAGLSLVLMIGVFVLLGGLPFFKPTPLYALPVAAVAFLLFLQLTPQRPFRIDFYIGLVFGTAVAASWLAAIYAVNGNLDFIRDSLIQTQLIDRAVDTFHHKEPWHYYLFRVPLMMLPWALLLLFLPWGKLFSRTTREAVAASRAPEKEGLAYLWCMVLSTLVLLSALSGKIVIYFLPALPAVLILLTRAALALQGKQATRFRLCTGIFFLAGGILVLLASLMLFGILPFPAIKGVPQWELPISGGYFIVAVLLLLTGAVLLQGLSSSRPEGVLLVLGISFTILVNPLAGLVAPTLDDVLSPKKQALIIRAYMQQGYTAATHNTYSGIYSFYAGGAIAELPHLDDAAALAENNKVILVLHAKQADRWINKPACFVEVDRQWLESRQYVLLACPPIPDLPPADVPYAPAPDIIGSIRTLIGLPAAPDVPPAPAKAEPPAVPPVPPVSDEERPAASEEPPAPVDAVPGMPENNTAPEQGAPSLPVVPEADEPVPAEEIPNDNSPETPAVPTQPADSEPAGDGEDGTAPVQDVPAAPLAPATPEEPEAPAPDAPGIQKTPEEAPEEPVPGGTVPEDPVPGDTTAVADDAPPTAAPEQETGEAGNI